MLREALLAFLVLAPVEVKLKWTDEPVRSAIDVALQKRDEGVEECVKNGLELRYRYEVRYCRGRALWFDACQEENVFLNTVQYDPVKEMYLVRADKLRDAAPPVVEQRSSLDEALSLGETLSAVSLRNLGATALKVGESEKARRYVSVRAVVECRGVQSETMRRLSYLLSFGLIRTAGYDSGWLRFDLDR